MRIQEVILRRLFLHWDFMQAEDLPADPERDRTFEELWRDFGDGEVFDYALPYPKFWFSCWLVKNKLVLLHGSNHAGIKEFVPGVQTNFKGKQVEGVFASSDGIWPFFFATINYQNPNFHSTRNGCYTLGDDKFYYFNIYEEAFEGKVWTEGWIYILPEEGFVSQDPEGMWRDEWVTAKRVKPLAVLPVKSTDFPFWQDVVGYQRGEGLLTTWRKYRHRRGV